MAKPELGTKRICPETGRKFYDLNRDPIVSPYTGKSYPLNYFEDTSPSSSFSSPSSSSASAAAEEEPEEKAVDETEEETGDADTVSLEEVEEDTDGKSEKLPNVDDDDDDEVEIDDDDDDTFLPDDEDDDDDDMSDIIGDVNDEEES